MNAVIETINSAGRAFVAFAVPMLIQSSVLILILLALDVLLRRRVRAVFRYWIWMLVLLKLVLPPSLGSPVSIGTWLGETLEPPQIAVDEPLAPQPQMPPAEWQPQAKLGDGTPVVVDHIREMQTSAPGVAAASDRVPTPEEAMSLPETPSPAASALGWQAVVLLVWLAVISALLLLLLQRAWFVRGLVVQAQESPPSLRTALDQCRRRMGVARPIAVRLSPNATSPAVCGLLRPVILIPQNLAPRLQPHDVQAVLLHELAHIKRGDLWVNLIQTLLQIVYFYNPLFWLANAMIRRAREQAVDEAVLVAMGETAHDYPETLLHIARLAFHRRPALSLRLIGVVESKSALRSRIQHILNRPLPKTARLGLLGLGTVVVVGTILLPMAKATPLASRSERAVASNQQWEAITEMSPASPDFTATLPNGVTVELLGVCEHPSAGRQWWRPEGTLLEGVLANKMDERVRVHGNDRAFEFAVRLRGLPSGSDVTMKTRPSRGRVTGLLPQANMRTNAYELVWFATPLPRALPSCTVHLAVATDPWETTARSSGREPISLATEPTGGVSFFASAENRKEGVIITTRDAVFERPCRIVAVTTDGRVVEPSWIQHGTIDRDFRETTAHFKGVTHAEIVEFQFQTRPWTWATFRNVSLKLDLQAPESATTEISGRVVDPNGESVAGAQVAWIDADRGVSITDGRLMAPRFGDRGKGPIVEPDGRGYFRFEEEPNDGFSLLAAHDAGFALIGSEQFAKDRVVRLQRWGRVEGQVARGREPLEGKIWMSGLPNSTWFEHRRDYRYEALCRADGRFTFKRVPPGWFEVGYLISNGDFSASLTSRTPVVVEPGQTATVTLGGEGRPVIGRFVPPLDWEGPIYFGAGLRALDTARPDPPRPADYEQMTNRQQQDWYKQWRKTPEAQAHYDAIWQNPDQRHYTFRIAVDGTFRIEDVIPGKYKLTVWLEERNSHEGPGEFGGYSGTIEVPPMQEAYSDEPLDVGDLVLKLRRPLHTGDMVPSFEAETVGGKPICLADYRGRFVLLSFWNPASHPELDRLKELHATYGATGRLQIIGLGGSDTLDEVKKFVAEYDVEWPQIYSGQAWDQGIAKQYGLSGLPYILLIDPDGKIVATWLRELKLTDAVREGLAAFTQD